MLAAKNAIEEIVFKKKKVIWMWKRKKGEASDVTIFYF